MVLMLTIMMMKMMIRTQLQSDNPNPNLFVETLKMLEKKLNSSGVCGFAMLRLFVAINGLVGY